MGDIADAVIEGMMCELCGVYLGIGPGYPRQCEDCQNEETQNGKNKSSKYRKDKKRKGR